MTAETLLVAGAIRVNETADEAAQHVVPRFTLPTDEAASRLIAVLTQYGSVGHDANLLHQLLVDQAPWVVGADGAAFQRVDGADLVTSHAGGVMQSAGGRRVPRHDSVAGAALNGDPRQLTAATDGDNRADAVSARESGIHTLVAAPLLLSQGNLAVLTLGYAESSYDEERLEFLAPFLALGVSRLDRVAMLDQRFESERLLATVGDASRAILVAADPETELCNWACRLSGAPLAVLFEPASSDGFAASAQCLIAREAPASARVHPVRLTGATASIVGAAYRSGQLQTLPDLRAEPENSPHLLQLLDDAKLDGNPSAAAIPLTSGDRPVGVLLLVLGEGLTTVDASMLGLIGLLAREAAVAIQRDHLRRELARQARSDDLTGLANRRAWQERLELEIARASRSRSPLCQVVLDLDHFKAYNDAHGHVAGDELLRATAEAWSGQIRETDLLARLGGEEFAVVLPDTPEEAAARIGQRLLDAMPAGTTASGGLALWSGEDLQSFYRRADQALYAAKAAGRHQLRRADAADES